MAALKDSQVEVEVEVEKENARVSARGKAVGERRTPLQSVGQGEDTRRPPEMGTFAHNCSLPVLVLMWVLVGLGFRWDDQIAVALTAINYSSFTSTDGCGTIPPLSLTHM